MKISDNSVPFNQELHPDNSILRIDSARLTYLYFVNERFLAPLVKILILVGLACAAFSDQAARFLTPKNTFPRT